MNTSEKERQQKVINGLISGTEFAVKQIVAERDAYRKAMNDLTMHGTETYSQIYLERKTKEIKDDFKAKMQVKYNEMVTRLEQLRQLIQERDQGLDLSNPALTNALSLIQAIGGDLSFEESIKINQNFKNDQSALRAIRAAYKANGVTMTGTIDNMIYNINDVINELLDLAEAGTIQESTMNGFAGKFAKFAAIEGLTVENTPDESGFGDALFRGAGLIQ